MSWLLTPPLPLPYKGGDIFGGTTPTREGIFWGDDPKFPLPSNFHKKHTDENPDDFTHSADDADKDAEGSRKAEGSDGEYEASLLNT